jgi:hypothetical protein
VFFTFEKNDHGRGPCQPNLRHLARIGLEKAVAQFESKRFPKNKAMLIVISRCGLPLKKSPETASCRWPGYFLMGCSELDLDEAF